MGISPTRLRQGCPLSPLLFKPFKEIISRHSQGLDRILFWNLNISAHDVPLASKSQDLQHVWDSVQPSVTQLGWQSAPPSPRSLFSTGKECLALAGLLESSTVWGGQMDWCSLCSYAVSILHRWKAKLSIYRPVYAPALTSSGGAGRRATAPLHWEESAEEDWAAL